MEKKYTIELDDNELAYKTSIVGGTPMIKQLIRHAYTEPDLDAVRKEVYDNGYEQGYDAGYKKADKTRRVFYEDGYERGLAHAWEAARKAALYSHEERTYIFGEIALAGIFTHCTASAAIRKIWAYDQKHEEQDGLRQNLQIFANNCGYTLDEIAEGLQKMRNENSGN